MKKWGWLSGFDLFSPSLDAVPHRPGQGSDGQAKNQWSDILGSLFTLKQSSFVWGPHSQAWLSGEAAQEVEVHLRLASLLPLSCPQAGSKLWGQKMSPPSPSLRAEEGTRVKLLPLTRKEGQAGRWN